MGWDAPKDKRWPGLRPNLTKALQGHPGIAGSHSVRMWGKLPLATLLDHFFACLFLLSNCAPSPAPLLLLLLLLLRRRRRRRLLFLRTPQAPKSPPRRLAHC